LIERTTVEDSRLLKGNLRSTTQGNGRQGHRISGAGVIVL